MRVNWELPPNNGVRFIVAMCVVALAFAGIAVVGFLFYYLYAAASALWGAENTAIGVTSMGGFFYFSAMVYYLHLKD